MLLNVNLSVLCHQHSYCLISTIMRLLDPSTSQPQYLRLNLLAPPDNLTLLHPSTSSLKLCNRSFSQTASIFWNNLPKFKRIFPNTLPNSITTVPNYHSHFLRSNFDLISKQTFSTSHTHLNLLYAWTDHIDLCPNIDVNCVLHTEKYTRGHFSLLFLIRRINCNITY